MAALRKPTPLALGWRRCRSLECGCDAKANPVRGGDGGDAEADPVRGGDGFIDPFLYVSGSEKHEIAYATKCPAYSSTGSIA
jgi:hypothetical protein